MAKKENNELEKRNQTFLIYQDENGIVSDNYDNYDSQNPRPHLQQKRHELFHIYI